VDEVDRLIHRFHARAAAPPLARLDILLDLRRHADPRIVPFLLQVLLDRAEAPEVRVAAWEEPELFTEEVRAAFRALRQS
jgi:hypothetical protein